MSDDVCVASVRKNTREHIRVSLQEYRGTQLASVRVWFDAADGTVRPGRDGINFRAELLPELAEAMGEAVREARARGLIEG